MPATVAWPVAPMLARLESRLPVGGYVYEPKWDGFRCVAFAAGGEVALQSRHGRPLGRYFPEVVAALRDFDAVFDGELLVHGPAGLDFGALLERLHPSASRVALLAQRTPAEYVVFDLLAAGGEDLRDRPFAERRAALEALLGGAGPPLRLTPATDSAALAAEWLESHTGRGLDGVVAKRHDLTYQPGKRAMVKVKKRRTIECVVAGMRRHGATPLLGSLLLGLYDGELLRHIGAVSSFAMTRRRSLLEELRPLVRPLAGHPWEHGFNLGRSPAGRLPGAAGRRDPATVDQEWVPLAPARVLEVQVDQIDGQRLRHAARFVRWRPDREPRSCDIEQLGS
jgi:ATP-dependent DNA ligase